MEKELLLSEADKLDPEKMATETLGWLIANVENYIDNAETAFLIYFTYDVLEESKLHELKRLQELYYAIPDSDEEDEEPVPQEDIEEMIQNLDGVLEQATKLMTQDKKEMQALFKRLIYYYEMVGFSKLTGPIIKEFDGHVQINHFVYEPVSMPITVTRRMKKMVDGELLETEIPDEVVSEYTVPEGYSLEIEIIKNLVED